MQCYISGCVYCRSSSDHLLLVGPIPFSLQCMLHLVKPNIVLNCCITLHCAPYIFSSRRSRNHSIDYLQPALGVAGWLAAVPHPKTGGPSNLSVADLVRSPSVNAYLAESCCTATTQTVYIVWSMHLAQHWYIQSQASLFHEACQYNSAINCNDQLTDQAISSGPRPGHLIRDCRLSDDAGGARVAPIV